MLIADAEDPKDAHANGAEGRTPCLTQDQDMLFLLYIVCFSCFCHLCYMCYEISTGRKTNKPRGRASAVSLISTCFFLMLLFTAHSPTNLCEKGWGYHCRVLVWLLALFAKLNWFFRKKCKYACGLMTETDTHTHASNDSYEHPPR